MEKKCKACAHKLKSQFDAPCDRCDSDSNLFEPFQQTRVKMGDYNTLQRINMTGFKGGYLHRIHVPGGWLVLFTNDVMTLDTQGEMIIDKEYRSSITFYPDPNHEWKATEVKLVPTVIQE